ncbi:MAG: 4Fe-4S cluster-binding domain-containing protein [Candidatus Parvarchaeota archaeon]|nr:4Fe-4S cluster-binding domain-containing protein [Candidatus Jingweiarchaeum tengchongense]MCW1298413.1 4Fe-4S cluster-binding domain-containing protein [Candidatus Jingweiarchaeum tengchongense]MCW1310823.1 4Fe-4S cluster-binding domain-containing protein [Candidatus Jingweiarchaeum tengchongense]
MDIYGIYLYITNKCNFECDFCRIDSKKYTTKEKINISKYLNNIVLSDKKPKYVCISGGEPTLFLKELIKIIKFLRKCGVQKVFMETNGSYASSYKKALKITKKLSMAGLTGIGFSFDTEHLKEIPFSYIINGIKAALKMKLVVKAAIIDKRNTVNINNMYLYQLIHELNAKYNFFLNNFIGKLTRLLIGIKYILLKVDGSILIIKRSGVVYFGRAKSLKGEFQIDKFYSFDMVDKIINVGVPCSYRKSHPITVDWNGNIFFCPMALNQPKVFSFGNIKKNNLFKAVENSRKEIGNITFSRIGLIKFYIYAKKNLDIIGFKEVLNKKYSSICDFCIIAHYKDIVKNFRYINLDLLLILNHFLRHLLDVFIESLGGAVRYIISNEKTNRILLKTIQVLY